MGLINRYFISKSENFRICSHSFVDYFELFFVSHYYFTFYEKTLFNQGDHGEEFWIVLTGEVRVLKREFVECKIFLHQIFLISSCFQITILKIY